MVSQNCLKQTLTLVLHITDQAMIATSSCTHTAGIARAQKSSRLSNPVAVRLEIIRVGTSASKNVSYVAQLEHLEIGF
jgi:hypothetical protein